MTQPAGSTAPETGATAASEPPPGSTPPAAVTTPPATPPAGQSETDTTDWKAKAEAAEADAAKWKAMSRKNEDDLKTERAAKAKAGMTDAEKAVEDAKAEGRKTAAVDFGKKLAAAKFEAAVAHKQIDLGDALEYIDLARFVDDAGEVDETAIKKAVAALAKQFAAKPAAAGKSGGEFDGGSGAGVPITEEQLKKMSPAEIAKALEEGKLKHLL